VTVSPKPRSQRRLAALAAAGIGIVAAATLAVPGAAQAGAPHAPKGGHPVGPRSCPPSATALSFSDALDKVSYGGATVGGLSSLAYDRRSGSWVSAVDNHNDDPARIWFFRGLNDPKITRAPLVLRQPNGTPYTGVTADNEGLAVLPDGSFLVSSETEPSIRIFGRDGVQRASLPVPARFQVAPAGQATGNATLEGLTLSPSGNRIVAAMEGALSGDVSAAGDATYHRFLVYDRGRGGRWTLTKQIGYRTETGNRVPEVVAYTNNKLVVEEAAFTAGVGNTVELYAVNGLDRLPDVSRVANLSATPNRVAKKTLVADVTKCPSLGATAKEDQANPLMDNFEGMALTGIDCRGVAGISLISDDNFSATQTTRILNLAVRLP
jgi:uncharacterized protein